jgi:hypothetical protein
MMTTNTTKTTKTTADSGAASTRTSISTNSSNDPVETSLFLQEAAPVLSLLSAVALSTLRNDVEVAQLVLNGGVCLQEINQPNYTIYPFPCGII